jgi:ketosteroid isomerase-like protein
VIEQLRVAVDALDRGDPEPFLALLDETCVWQGIAGGHLWWKHAPS